MPIAMILFIFSFFIFKKFGSAQEVILGLWWGKVETVNTDIELVFPDGARYVINEINHYPFHIHLNKSISNNLDFYSIFYVNLQFMCLSVYILTHHHFKSSQTHTASKYQYKAKINKCCVSGFTPKKLG